jgi:hypothetical protein
MGLGLLVEAFRFWVGQRRAVRDLPSSEPPQQPGRLSSGLGSTGGVQRPGR